MTNNYYQKTKKRFKKKHVKGTKIFLKKKKTKSDKYACEQCRNLSEEEKKSVNMIVNNIRIF